MGIEDPEKCGIRDQLVFSEGPGSRTTVVWNPWIEKAIRMNDFGDDEYKRMVCVETTNADTDVISLAPGSTHTLESVVRVEPLTDNNE